MGDDQGCSKLHLSQKPFSFLTALIEVSVKFWVVEGLLDAVRVPMDSSKDSHSKYCLSRRASWRYISSAPRMVAILSQREDSLDALEKKNSDRRDHKDLITDQVQEYRRKPCTHRLVLLEPYGSTTRIEATLNALHMILRGEVAQYNTTMPPMAQQATTMSVVRQEFSERPDLDAFIPPEQ